MGRSFARVLFWPFFFDDKRPAVGMALRPAGTPLPAS